MRCTRAIARTPGHTFAQGLTTSNLGSPDLDTVLAQHAAYCRCLEDLGVEVTVLDPLPDYPDSCFVEDTAVLADQGAAVSRPGADSRRGEAALMTPVLEARTPTRHIEAPGTLDGGDVLRMGNRFFIGISERTNDEGARQLGAYVEQFGFTWTTVPVGKGLHLKSLVNELDADARLIIGTQAMSERPEFADFDFVVVPEAEAYAANLLNINGTIIMAAGFPRTRALVDARCYPVRELACTEFEKMDGGLTCLSLRF